MCRKVVVYIQLGVYLLPGDVWAWQPAVDIHGCPEPFKFGEGSRKDAVEDISHDGVVVFRV